MSSWQSFDYEEEDRVARVTFARPDRLNSLTFDVYRELRDLTAELKTRPDEITCLVIRGTGRGFCSGGDVDEIIGELLKADTRSSSRILFRDSKGKAEQRSRSRRNTARSKVSIR